MSGPFLKVYRTRTHHPRVLAMILFFAGSCSMPGFADAHSAMATEAHEWWAIQPLAQPEIPHAENDNWSRNPIDHFVYNRMQAAGITPAPNANKRTLVRRLYYDLIGLPPTPEEWAAFEKDDGPDPWNRLIDKLLADPRYGEHWARFWLDLVRYAESDGWNKDSYRPNIWRYRDYVVKSFNEDKPYPEFVREQLAGDELPGDDPDQLVATGFLRLGIYEYNQRDARSHWNDIMNEMTDVTGDVFLGVSMSCSRCHNHKFDPIPQTDYFGLRAFFEPLIWHDDIPGATQATQAAHDEQQRIWEAATREIRDEIDSLCQPYYRKKWDDTVDKFPLDIQDCFNKAPEERSSWEHQMAMLVVRQFYEEGTPALSSMKEKDKEHLDFLNRQLSTYDAMKPKAMPAVMSVRDFNGALSPTFIPTREDQPVEPRFLSVLSVDETPVPATLPDSSGRRTALAEWIGHDNNPLTTRLIVNRIWQQHFGRGIVTSANDFGRLGEEPTHPKLLDWLTQNFVENGWQMKNLHKMILMSAVWQQASYHPEANANLEKDPAVQLLWRAQSRRLKAEEIRDSMLSVTGELDGRLGGPSVKADVPKRALYVQSHRNSPDALMQLFDAANGLTSIAQRSNTVTPTQALLMMNGDYALARARKLASRLMQENHARPEAAIARAFRLAWGREATRAERARATAYVTAASDGTSSSLNEKRLGDFCHILFNANEFFYVD